MSEKSQASVSIPKWLWDNLIKKYNKYEDYFLNKTPPIKTPTKLVRFLIEQFITNFSVTPPYLHHNTYGDHTSIRDNKLEKLIDVYLKEDSLWCEECELTDCGHVEFTLSLDQVKEAYQKKGLKMPNS